MNVTRSYIICTTPRSGSNLLCDYLTNDGRFGRPWEFFNPDVIQHGHAGERFEWSGQLDMEEYLRWVERTFASKNGVFGVKIFYDDFIKLSPFPGFQNLFCRSTRVFLRRKSLVDQAVSLYFAQQSGQWLATDEPITTVEHIAYNFDALSELIDNLNWQLGQWRTILNCFDNLPFEICTEDMIESPLREVSRIADILSLPRPNSVSTEMKAQFNDRKTQIKQELIGTKRARMFGFTAPAVHLDNLVDKDSEGSGAQSIRADDFRASG